MMKVMAAATVLGLLAVQAQACVVVERDPNFSQNKRVFLVNTCSSNVEIIDTSTGNVAYILSPGTKGIAFSTWSWRYR